MELLHGVMLAQTSCVKLKCAQKSAHNCTKELHVYHESHGYTLQAVCNFRRYLTCISWRLCYLFMTIFTPNCLLSFRNLFKFNCDVYDVYVTRRAHMFHIPRTKSSFVDKLPLYNFPSTWNNWYTQLNVNATRGTLCKLY